MGSEDHCYCYPCLQIAFSFTQLTPVSQKYTDMRSGPHSITQCHHRVTVMYHAGWLAAAAQPLTVAACQQNTVTHCNTLTTPISQPVPASAVLRSSLAHSAPPAQPLLETTQTEHVTEHTLLV